MIVKPAQANRRDTEMSACGRPRLITFLDSQLTILININYFEVMVPEERIKIIKHRLIDMGISLREWCRRNELSYSVVRDIMHGRLDGSKSDKTLKIKDKISQEFGQNIF